MDATEIYEMLARTRGRASAMTSVWPNWRVTYEILERPHWEVMKWLNALRAAVMGGIETFEHHIACGGLNVELVDTCDCVLSLSESLKVSRNDTDADEALTWIHNNHRAYNRAQRHIIEDNIGLAVFREILERDLTFENKELGPKWGNLLLKEHASALITNFVDSTAWC